MSRIHQRRWPALIAGVLLIVLAPLAGSGVAAAAPPPAQDTSTFCANATQTNPFSDVDASNNHFANILCLVSAGITQGKTATTYGPLDPVTRGQMATFVARAIDEANSLAEPGANLNVLPPYDGVNQFTDVSNSDAHVASINRLAKAGIVHGKTATTYAPLDNVTRGQMATFINGGEKFLTGTAYSTNQDFFTDDNGNTHEANINAIASVGIAQGLAGTSYGPDQPVRRDQMASFLIRWLSVENAAGNIKPLPAGGVHAQSTAFSDADQSGALSLNDTITITFANPVVLFSSLTLKDADNTTAVLTDDPGHPANETTSTFTLDGTKKILTVKPTEAVKATGGDATITGNVTITGASGIKDESSGDPWDPASDTQANVQFTIPSAVGETGVVTFVDTAADTYRFSPTGGGAEKTVIYKAGDTFTDDGTSATMAKFETDISVGDGIKFTKDSPSAGKNKHELTNQTPASFTQGMVGDVDTLTHTFFIIDPASGVELSNSKAYNGELFTLNGSSATQAQFEAAINEGDSVVITAGTSGNPDTYALTDAQVSGTVSTVDAVLHQVMVGALGDDPTSGQNTAFDYSLANTTRTIDGASATVAEFDAALNQGDTLVYARTNSAGVGTQTFALTNQAPDPISGTVTETHDPATNTATVVEGPTRTAVDYTGFTHFTVDGVSATEAELEADITVGDSLVFQAPDAQTSTVGSVALTNSNPDKTVTGHMADINTGAQTYDVVNDDGGIIYDDLPYLVPPPPDFGAAPQRYFVKAPSGTESEVTLVQWNAYLNKISGASSPIADITAGLNAAGTAIEHHLTTDQTIP